MLKIGLAGTWHVHFDGYAKHVAQRGDCKITALWEERADWGQPAAARYDCPYYDCLDTFLRQDFDAILCCAATNRHPEVLTKAAQAGKHIFTEKVLAVRCEDAWRIRDAVLENGVKFCISFPWRSRGDFLWIKQALDEGMFGQITYCRMRNAHNGVSGGWLPPHFLDRDACGGGAMMDLGAHPMYLLNWFMGTPTKITSAFTNCLCETVEDNAVSVLTYPDGAIGVSETGFAAQNNPFSLEIVGTKGTVFAGGLADRLAYNLGDGWVYPTPPAGAPAPLDSFLNGCLHGTPILYDIHDAVALTETMAAAYQSCI